MESPVETGAQDRGDRSVGPGTDRQPTLAGCLQPSLAVGFGELQNAQAGPETLLGMGLGLDLAPYVPSFMSRILFPYAADRVGLQRLLG